MSHRINRRRFLHSTAAAGAGFWVAQSVAAQESKSPNEKLNMASIGVGGKGTSDMQHASNYGNMVAVCDCDEGPLNGALKRFPNAKAYTDFRKMFDEMGKSIDAVTVSTPDHTHAPASIMAMRLGKHVYCQKPLTHTVYEARLMRTLAEEKKLCTQMGNQGTAENGLRTAVEAVRAGVIGQVKEVHVWTNRPIWPQAPGIMARPKDTPPVPKTLNWDAFLGPAPERPYHSAYHPFKWRGWWDYGTGALGDMACHTANMAFMALKLGHPISAYGECGDLNPETCPSWATVTLEFPARGDMGPVTWMWYEGRRGGKKNLPREELVAQLPKTKSKSGEEQIAGSGSLLVGEKGLLYSPNDYGAAFTLLPAKNFEGYKPPAPTLPRNGKGDDGMKAEWVRAIRAGKPEIAMSNFTYAGMLTEAVLLGNVAMRIADGKGKKFAWDGPNLKSPDCPEIAGFVTKEYRKGWEIG
jgi:predicted dehydrogenase